MNIPVFQKNKMEIFATKPYPYHCTYLSENKDSYRKSITIKQKIQKFLPSKNKK